MDDEKEMPMQQKQPVNFWKFCNESPFVVIICVIVITEMFVRILK